MSCYRTGVGRLLSLSERQFSLSVLCHILSPLGLSEVTTARGAGGCHLFQG